MKNKKLIALAIAGGTLAYFTDSDNKTNVITMGHVDVDLEEPGWENPNNVQPGNKYLKDPQISVVDGSEDAYLRAKVTVTLKDKNGNDVMVDGEQLLPALSEVVDINDGWNPTPDADGYYYYNTKVSAPTTVSLFKVKGEGENKYTVEIPMSWGNAYADTVLTIDIVAEGIQADNFTPQMDGTNIIGWNDVTAETYNK